MDSMTLANNSFIDKKSRDKRRMEISEAAHISLPYMATVMLQLFIRDTGNVTLMDHTIREYSKHILLERFQNAFCQTVEQEPECFNQKNEDFNVFIESLHWGGIFYSLEGLQKMEPPESIAKYMEFNKPKRILEVDIINATNGTNSSSRTVTGGDDKLSTINLDKEIYGAAHYHTAQGKVTRIISNNAKSPLYRGLVIGPTVEESLNTTIGAWGALNIQLSIASATALERTRATFYLEAALKSALSDYTGPFGWNFYKSVKGSLQSMYQTQDNLDNANLIDTGTNADLRRLAKNTAALLGNKTTLAPELIPSPPGDNDADAYSEGDKNTPREDKHLPWKGFSIEMIGEIQSMDQGVLTCVNIGAYGPCKENQEEPTVETFAACGGSVKECQQKCCFSNREEDFQVSAKIDAELELPECTTVGELLGMRGSVAGFLQAKGDVDSWIPETDVGDALTNVVSHNIYTILNEEIIVDEKKSWEISEKEAKLKNVSNVTNNKAIQFNSILGSNSSNSSNGTNGTGNASNVSIPAPIPKPVEKAVDNSNNAININRDKPRPFDPSTDIEMFRIKSLDCKDCPSMSIKLNDLGKQVGWTCNMNQLKREFSLTRHISFHIQIELKEHARSSLTEIQLVLNKKFIGRKKELVLHNILSENNKNIDKDEFEYKMEGALNKNMKKLNKYDKHNRKEWKGTDFDKWSDTYKSKKYDVSKIHKRKFDRNAGASINSNITVKNSEKGASTTDKEKNMNKHQESKMSVNKKNGNRHTISTADSITVSGSSSTQVKKGTHKAFTTNPDLLDEDGEIKTIHGYSPISSSSLVEEGKHTNITKHTNVTKAKHNDTTLMQLQSERQESVSQSQSFHICGVTAGRVNVCSSEESGSGDTNLNQRIFSFDRDDYTVNIDRWWEREPLMEPAK